IAGPVKVATSWKLFEVSATPIGADEKAKARGINMETTIQTKPDQSKETRSNSALDERKRCQTINDLCGKFGLTEFATRFIQDGTEVEEVRNAVFDHLAKTRKPMGADRIDFEGGETSGEKREKAVIDGLLTRSGFNVQNPAPGHDEFRHVKLADLAADALRKSGVTTRGLPVSEIITRSMTTSDFSGLLSGYANKALREAYENSPGTYQKWTSKRSAEDFKPLRSLSLSEGPDLSEINEGSEYEYGQLNEGSEVYQVAKFGKIVKLSWESLINDDLNAFSRSIRILTSAAKRQLNKSVYSVLGGSYTMADGVALFHATHNNLADTGADPSVSMLTEARKAMRLQTGLLSSDPLNIQPKFLIVPAVHETNAHQLIETAAGYDVSEGHGVSNPFYKALEVVTDPQLDGISGEAWYLSADPRMFDTIEVAYLDGQEQPYTEEKWGFGTDSYSIKVRFVYGVAPIDHRGLFKNSGE
ncbi:MAG: Mu-like prophage major head subunit gpT family protein, partial [Desulfobacteraceae bacterium]|nr:Mu-like prophage major head subunit gpT family protein [Desulfobacteraceae bacterium]